ncbi:MAG: tRNA lysidine(34) synthetase TilS [Pseudomonadota bacterium]|nr:tRNA lysidine(34) synthetase TilS [Pseudomonadota bacterium]MDP1902997.1 tRNA lysidine(34) synthetase TilS [Pseudomonadota bacterium]MDP2352231.1 tRNA lysidine(34) synthetase TilS [Pseudomonadota bacterium]
MIPPSGDLPARVAQFLRRHSPGRHLAVAYSGGLDSTVLLHLLAGLRGEEDFQLSAVHVHHGLSADADAWASHCQAVCATLNVPLRLERVVVKRAGQGLEAAAREARYQVFSSLAVDALALAHQRDDQAETVLLQLFRGAGMKGLAAMPAERALGTIRLLRPLLDATRGEIEAFARARGFSWVDDASNADTDLRRNAVRHHLLPRIDSLFPGAGQTLARAAGRFAESAGLLDALAELDGADCRDGLEVARLMALDAARGRNLLRRYLELRGHPVRRERLHEALAQMLGARADAEPAVDFGAATLRRFQGRLLLVEKSPPPTTRDWVWRGETELDLGAGGRLRFTATTGEGARLPSRATVRLRTGGERLQPDARRPERTLKNLLREAAVPPWLRERLPLLYVDGRLAWAAELGVDAAFQPGPEEPGWLIAWWPA